MNELRRVPSSTPPDSAWDRFPFETLQAVSANRDDLWELVRKVWRRKWMVVLVAFGVVVLAAGLSTLITPRYAAETRVLIGVEEPRIINIEAILKGLTPNTEVVQSEAILIGSRELGRTVAYRMALDKVPEFNPLLEEPGLWDRYLKPSNYINTAAIKAWIFGPEESDAGVDDGMSEEDRLWEPIISRLLRRVEVTPINRSYVLSAKTESEDPLLAARLANSFAEVYVEQQLARKQRVTERANDWMQNRITDLQRKVDESERAVEKYRREHGLYQTKSDTVIAQQLATLNQELVAAENAKVEAESRLVQAEGQLKSSGTVEGLPAVLQSALIKTLREQQAELQKQKAEALSIYTSKHPRIRDLQAQLNENAAKIKTEAERVVGGLRHEAQIARERFSRDVTRKDELKGQMGRANEKTVKLNELEREAQANRNVLETLLRREKETTDQQKIQIPNAEIISRANVPLAPSFPPTTLIVVLASIIGVGCGVLSALFLESLDQTFRTGDAVEEYTGLPSLALVPSVRKRRAPIDLVVRQPHSSFSGSLRTLGVRLSLGADHTRGLVMFTSALPGEGKTMISTSFAQLMALDGLRVMLIDLDWERPSLHRMFGQNRRSAGLAELLNGDIDPKQAVYHDPKSGAHVMFAGDASSMRKNTAWIDRLRVLLQALSRHYDLVILDTPPVIVAPEVLSIGRLAAKTVLVAKWGSTPRRVIASELRNLLRVGATVSGVVLSQVDPSRYKHYGYSDAESLRYGHYGLDSA